MKINACIFDLDGVIVDTARFHYAAWKATAAGLGFDFTGKDNERLKGVSRMRSLDILLELGNIVLPEAEKQRLANEKNRDYLSYVSRMTQDDLLPGVTGFLDELKSNGMLLALGSASKNTPLILEKTGIAGRFDAIVDGNAVTCAKPDPEVFLKGAAWLGVDPSVCLVFEDAQAGIDAARNAGMHVIGIGSAGNLTGADHLVSGLEMLDYKLLTRWYP